MITCAISKPPPIPTASMRIEIPAAAPLDTPFVLSVLLPPGLPVGLAVEWAGGRGRRVGLKPTKNEDLAASNVSVKTK